METTGNTGALELLRNVDPASLAGEIQSKQRELDAAIAARKSELAYLRMIGAAARKLHGQPAENGPLAKTRKAGRGRTGSLLEPIREHLQTKGPAKVAAIAKSLGASHGGVYGVLKANKKLFQKTADGWGLKR
jgi:hypothetical protein